MAIVYNTNYDLTMPFSDTCWQLHLTSAADQSFTVPGTSVNKYSARFTYTSTANVFVRIGTAATIPADDTVEAEAYSEFRPGCDGTQRYLKGGDVVYFNTPDADAYVGVRLMSVPT